MQQKQWNPAYVNLFEIYTDGNPLEADIAYRRQWIGYEDAPTTILAGMKYSNLGKTMSYGGFVTNDQFGPTDFTELRLQYAYQLHFDRGEDHFLSLGLSLSTAQFRIQGSQFRPEISNDPLLSDEDHSEIVANAGIGAYYVRKLSTSRYGGTFLLAGLSADQLIPARPLVGNDITGSLERARHYYGYLGTRYYYDSEGADYIQPYVSGAYVEDAPVHYNLGVEITGLQQHIFGGAAFVSTFQMQWHVGFGIHQQWKVYYSNTFFLNSTVARDAGLTHEIGLAFRNLLGW